VPVLVLTPRDNEPSRRSASWADRLATAFSSVLSLQTTKSRPAVETLLREHQHVLYFGHGEIDALVIPRRRLRSRQVLIDASNVTGERGRIVVAVACWSGEGLAQTVTRPDLPKRIASYIGWRDEVSWPPDWPDPIGETVVDGISTLLDGGTVGACANAIRRAFDSAHDRYRGKGVTRLGSDRAAFGKMCAAYWQARMAVEGDHQATL
jgi:hypothetical protein